MQIENHHKQRFMDFLVVITSPFKRLSFVGFSKSNSFRYCSLSLFHFKISRRFKRSSLPLAVNSLNPGNPNSVWGNCVSPLKPFSYLIPFLQNVRDFAVKSSKQNWASVFQYCSVQETSFFQNDALATAVVSATAAAQVKISPFVATLAANPTFVSPLCAWAIAQSSKVLLNFCVERKWDFRIMFASGGMPSSHSALCTALTTSVAICHGVADSLFSVCMWFSMIVMYDATGVRRHAGMQAEVLNLIVEDLFQGHPISQRKLKELLGHTPSQVFAGAILGVTVAWLCCKICLSPV